MDMPMISVITLSYFSKFLFETIESVLSQSYPCIQYIISDDGTKNFDENAVRAYVNENRKRNLREFLLLHSEENTGTVRNANRALKVAKGKLIFYLSSDDVFVSEDVLKDWTQYMVQENSLLCTSYRECYNTEYNRVFEILPYPYQVKLLKRKKNRDIFDELSKCNFIFGCCTAISRRCIQQYGVYDENYRLIEDYPYILSFVRRGGRIDFYDGITVRCRTGGISSSAGFSSSYEVDSDKIFEREILPYSSVPKKVIKYYNQWKKWHIEDVAFLKDNAACNGNKKKLIILYVRYPHRGINVLKRKLMKRRRIKNANC